MTRNAIILAGGFGTRLQSVVSDLPKPMADISGKPFLHYLISYLKHFDIDNIVLCTGYLHHKVEEYFGTDYNGSKIQYSVEESPLGTGGAVAKALKLVEGDCFILNGDSFIEANFKSLYDFHIQNKSDFSICLKEMKNFDRYGTVLLNEKRITAFKEKQFTERGFINTGVYLTSSEIFEGLNLSEKFSLESEFLEVNVDKVKIFGMPVSGYFIDIGIPEDYQKAKTELPLLLKNFS